MAQQDITSLGTKQVGRTITIRRSPDDLYRAWRSLGELPVFMGNVLSVVEQDHSARWTVRTKDGEETLETVITDDRPGRALGWKTVDGSQPTHAGSVMFAPSLQGKGTEVHVSLTWHTDDAELGGILSRFAEDPGTQLKDDLWRFKRLMETGHLPTTHGQSRGSAQEDDLREERAAPDDQSVFSEGIDGR